MRRLAVCLTVLLLAGCAGPLSPIDDPMEKTFEVYRTTQSYDDVVARLNALVVEQRWLKWMARGTSCIEWWKKHKDRWGFLCGVSGPLRPTGKPHDPFFQHSKWVIVERLDSGANILVTPAIRLLIGNYHPNTEIFDKAGIKADLVGTRAPG